ncbi:FBP1-like protein [Mya arenaria]|uniref:FBP1-like protein n=1 Tax=Mya arenaria TaxID=6604 RepID=A0ABY7EI79_MYAAR|nr:FBP1-like protein [Mya arenaria]
MFTCQCLTGFEGADCGTNDDDCVSHGCLNGAACVDEPGSYSCKCVSGYSGDFCETNDDDCVSHGCVNGAACVDGTNNDNDCLTNPCQNSGACADGINTYTCTCIPGYTGTNCETNDDDCVSHGCLNGAACVDEPGGYTCTCSSGFNGDFCETNVNECSTNPCQNGGACTDGVNMYTCSCIPGYTGTNCETNDDDCVSHGCLNSAACVDKPGSYTCTCASGYSGDFCETNDNNCSPNPCVNGGACANGINTYTCTCISGYTGTNCETDIDGCLPPPCKHGGTCTDIVNGYQCTCADGYEGVNCETNINDCSPNPCENDINECLPNVCKNGATCVDQVNSYTCQCMDGYDGTYCEQSLLGDTCTANSGICANIVFGECSGTECVCQSGYYKTGPDTCSPVDCGPLSSPDNGAVDQTGGTTYTKIALFSCNTGYARIGVASVTCQSNITWSGTTPVCEDINECLSNLCKNGATCADEVNSYTCQSLGDTCSGDSGVCGNIVLGECSGIECVCQSGHYKTGPATCSPIDCGTLASPNNGAVDQTDGTTVTKIAVFSCNTGYALNDCGVPVSIANGDVSYPDVTLVGATATYSCTQGYTLSGSATSVCQTDGTWSDHGVCFVDCGTLTNPTNGEVMNPSVTSVGQVATYSCFVGYGLVGSKVRTCQSNGAWSGAAPICVFGCEAPVFPANGRVNTTEGLAVGHTIYYTCVDGYELVGQAERICEASSTWSGTAPSCLIKCPLIGSIENGKVDMSWGRHEGSLASFACNTNYALVGDPIISCESTGVWGGIQPTCVFAMFPDIILAFGAVLILLIIVDIFVVGICLYYRYCRSPGKTPTDSGLKQKYSDIFGKDREEWSSTHGKFDASGKDADRLGIKAKVLGYIWTGWGEWSSTHGKFDASETDDQHPPPTKSEESNVVYRSTMKMSNSVLGNLFSKGSKYQRPEDEGRAATPYMDGEQMNDNGYVTGGSHSLEVTRSDDFDKLIEIQSTPGSGDNPRERRKLNLDDSEIKEVKEGDDRYLFPMRGTAGKSHRVAL